MHSKNVSCGLHNFARALRTFEHTHEAKTSNKTLGLHIIFDSSKFATKVANKHDALRKRFSSVHFVILNEKFFCAVAG